MGKVKGSNLGVGLEVSGSERVRGKVRGQCRVWVKSMVARELGVRL